MYCKNYFDCLLGSKPNNNNNKNVYVMYVYIYTKHMYILGAMSSPTELEVGWSMLVLLIIVFQACLFSNILGWGFFVLSNR